MLNETKSSLIARNGKCDSQKGDCKLVIDGQEPNYYLIAFAKVLLRFQLHLHKRKLNYVQSYLLFRERKSVYVCVCLSKKLSMLCKIKFQRIAKTTINAVAEIIS